MNWSITTIIPLLASIFYGGLFVVVAFFTPLNQQRKILVIYLLSMLVWSISAFMTVSGLVEVIFWFRIMVASAMVMFLAIFYLVQVMFARRYKWTPFVLLYTALTIGFVLFSDEVIPYAALNAENFLVYEFRFWVYLIAGPGYVLMFFTFVDLINGARKTDNPVQANRLRYLVIALSFTILVSVINFTELGKYPIDIAANMITAIIIAYAILRLQLLEIRVVLRLGILYSITTTIFGAIYYLVIYLSMDMFRIVSGENIFWIATIIAFFTALILTPFRNSIQTWIDKVFYRERYNAGLMLQRLSEATASLMDMEDITRLILDEVTTTLHLEKGAIYVKQNPYGQFFLFAQHNLDSDIAETFRNDHPMLQWLSSNNQVLTRHQLSNLPIFKGLWHQEKVELDNLGMELFIPLQAKGKLVGLLMTGKKLSTQVYTQEDQQTLITLGNQMAVAIENARLYEELEDTFEETVVALANAIDLRDTYTSDHSQQIAYLAAETAQELNLPEEQIDAVYWGGLLHDIGKIGIPDSILQKPAKLDESEWAMIRQHPKMGADLVAKINKLSHVAPLIEYSHERHDGSGYPYGLAGDNIPIGARIIAVVDSYSAMIDERAYKAAMTEEEALEELRVNSGTLYDPFVLEAFFKVHQNGKMG